MTTAPAAIQNVSDTAFMVAMWRAHETKRPDALFRDPLAAKLAGQHGKAILRAVHSSRAAGMGPRSFGEWSVVIRTVIIDDFIRAAIEGGTDTVLNLGAGLDTRPYRMPLPEGLRWIEVDQAPVIDLKERELAAEAPRCSVERFTLDLTAGPARSRLFADVDARSKQALVLTEGVIPYWTSQDVGHLADDLRAMKSARGWIVDYLSPQTLRHRERWVKSKHLRNVPFRFEPDDWLGFFSGHGWKEVQTRYLAAEGKRLNRPIPLPAIMRFWFKLRRLFLSQGQRESMAQFAGYTLLEPK